MKSGRHESKQARRRLRQIARSELRRVQELVSQWDPYGLIAIGAPPGEYDSEAIEIYSALRRGCASEGELASRIASVFQQAFDERGLTTESCRDLAHDIWLWWSQRSDTG